MYKRQEWHRLEGVDLGFSLDNEGQRRGHDTSDVEGPVVQHGKQPGGIDAYQPVRLGAAESRIPQTVIILSLIHISEAENLEIVQMVRAMRMTPAQLNAMLSGGTLPGTAAASADSDEQEDNAHEE